jgi:hypothetical protein
MAAGDQLRNDPEIVMRAVMSVVERVQMCVDNGGCHFENAHHTLLQWTCVNNVIKDVCNVISNLKSHYS